MELKLHSNQRIRVSTSDSYLDVEAIEHEIGLMIDLYPNFTEHAPYKYIELREKKGWYRLFCFKCKSYKKDYDFNYWNDAKIVWSKHYHKNN